MGNALLKWSTDHSMIAFLLVMNLIAGDCRAKDWPMRGLNADHNPVSLETDAPVDWSFPENDSASTGQSPPGVKWIARLGSDCTAEPVISNGLVWVGTNNGYRNDPKRDPKQTEDACVLMCFCEKDGRFLYQHLSPRLERLSSERRMDWPHTSLATSPLAEGNRIWFCTNRCEVICLDVANLINGTGGPETIWKYDMMQQLNVEPRGVHLGTPSLHCSVGTYRDLIYVHTMNANWSERRHRKHVPGVVCLNKNDGTLRWSAELKHAPIDGAQYGNPLCMEVAGECQVVLGQADGWVRSFDALSGRLLWEFDLNEKARADGKKHQFEFHIVATPVHYDGRVYLAAGMDREFVVGSGRLLCLDPTRRGDITEFIVDAQNRFASNPNSGVIWEYPGSGDPKAPSLQRALASPAIHEKLLIIPDSDGVIHCVDRENGHPLWIQDTDGESISGSALIVDNKIYVNTDGGKVFIFRLAATKEVISVKQTPFIFYVAPVFANGTLFLTGSRELIAIRK